LDLVPIGWDPSFHQKLRKKDPRFLTTQESKNWLEAAIAPFFILDALPKGTDNMGHNAAKSRNKRRKTAF
jgi:hypothetical protein